MEVSVTYRTGSSPFSVLPHDLALDASEPAVALACRAMISFCGFQRLVLEWMVGAQPKKSTILICTGRLPHYRAHRNFPQFGDEHHAYSIRPARLCAKRRRDSLARQHVRH